MKIAFERSGGFAGLRLTATIETDDLPPDEAAELVQMVEDARFFDLPGKLRARPGAADEYQYLVTIATDDQRHTVETTDTAAPETLRTLLNRLNALARRRR
ncbi:MAG: hypothetical protein IT320_19160 [Anaerolineae bacterium]|nr:hypothetical protein [Anaerolineae bacterium]